MSSFADCLPVQWPGPVAPQIQAACTTRAGGVSAPPWNGQATGQADGWNLAAHVGDAEQAVLQNRAILRQRLALPQEPCWLNQVHGVALADADQRHAAPPTADAVTSAQGGVCAILTADCLPVLLCSPDGAVLAAAHAGWRGLAGGVLQATAGAMRARGAQEIYAWLGPAISQPHFEVGPEVLAAFVQSLGEAAQAAFVAGRADRVHGDLFHLARLALAQAGVTQVAGGGVCTFSDARFYSYRRQARTGRFASLLWRAAA
ncbi:peptidoglycan editing factor PgeF [Massilia sp. W12]|uniref:peptidoglycan editing factor PgeF n=1 Tax=Massilia sp. W12 TaxID=3126507 RepID=UPI0030CC1DBF